MYQIVVGIIAAIANEQGGPTAPLKCSFVLLVLGAIIIQATWKENYGDQSSQLSTGVKDGFKVVLTNKNVALVGFMQSLFEGAMYSSRNKSVEFSIGLAFVTGAVSLLTPAFVMVNIWVMNNT